MIKKLALLGLMGISLTGCIVAPYDDGYNRHDHRHNSDRRWDRNDQQRWDNQRNNDRRDWNKDRPYWYDR